MNQFDRLLKKPSKPVQKDQKGRFEKFNLRENPFPSEPFVNKDATDNRLNGKIFEMEIRKKEYEHIENNFLKASRNDPEHLRMGLIMDTSYVGIGSGKSSFLINLMRKINEGFCLDISNNRNKCFSVYTSPGTGGRTKTFSQLIDLVFESILSSNIINNCLATIRLEALLSIKPDFNPVEIFNDEKDLIEKLNSREWLKNNANVSIINLNNEVLKDDLLINLPGDFPLYRTKKNLLTDDLVTQDKFKEYYLDLKQGQERIDFIFSHLVKFFLAANFNGAFILVDDFERIPDFQSARQKRDFALELRNCMYDGLYTNARIGFYTFILAVHAGVPRLLQEAWLDSGMENRVPIAPSKAMAEHLIPFERLSREHAVLLFKRYLSEYRNGNVPDDIWPFTRDAIYKIAEISELNAAKMLKLANDLLEKASLIKGQNVIDEPFVRKSTAEKGD